VHIVIEDCAREELCVVNNFVRRKSVGMRVRWKEVTMSGFGWC
jgi:hypothetical protein